MFGALFILCLMRRVNGGSRVGANKTSPIPHHFGSFLQSNMFMVMLDIGLSRLSLLKTYSPVEKGLTDFRISKALSLSGTRCSILAFMRFAAIVQSRF